MVPLGVGGQARGEERESERERMVGDGQPVWGEEAWEGGVLTVVEEALRCFSEEFSLIDTLLQPAIPSHPANPHSSNDPLLLQTTITESFPPLSFPPSLARRCTAKPGMFQPELFGQWS